MTIDHSLPETFQTFVAAGDPATAAWQQRKLTQPANEQLLVRVTYSSLNYKDALAAAGHPGVARQLPLVPGIDAVGTVAVANDPGWQSGDEVLIADAEFGTAKDGGFTQYATVPADWCYRLPDRLSAVDAATWGTAGFTAAQSVEQLLQHGIQPQSGPVVVTGSTGGVGIFAVALLGKLGFEVVAVTGKSDRADWLKSIGASQVVGRDALDDHSNRPLLKGLYAGAVDTVGGNPLQTILRSVKNHGCVTACGLVAGTDLNTSVYPFILRGITLCGIDSANLDRATRQSLWEKIAGPWQLDCLPEIRTVIERDGLEDSIRQITAGKIAGRMVLDLFGEDG
jgi:acrylyl-CoA reductase (NADPH)